MIAATDTTATLRLINSMLDQHDDQDHSGAHGHLIAARTQVEAVINLQALQSPGP